MRSVPGYLILTAFVVVFTLQFFSCGGGQKKKRPRVAPIAELPDTNVLQTEALGMRWYPYSNGQLNFRISLPRSPISDMVDKDSVVRFIGWMQPDTSMFKAGIYTYLANEPGFLFQVYKRPLTTFGKEYFDFEDLGADFYRTHALDRRRPLINGNYIMLQDSTVRAFAFDTEVDFGANRRTPLFVYPDRLTDDDENTQLRTPARVVYLSHKKFNFRIIYERGNSITEGMFNSLFFY